MRTQYYDISNNEKIESQITNKRYSCFSRYSEGTVDRVLHQRGDVSAKSLEAVNKVLEETNYSPNIIARSLASKKHYRFVCLYPAHQPLDYWQSVDEGFDLAAQEFIHYNVEIEKKYFNQFDVNSFVRISNEILAAIRTLFYCTNI